jgi:hypothetical protein
MRCLPLVRMSSMCHQHLQVYGADHVMAEIKQDNNEVSRSSAVLGIKNIYTHLLYIPMKLLMPLRLCLFFLDLQTHGFIWY